MKYIWYYTLGFVIGAILFHQNFQAAAIAVLVTVTAHALLQIPLASWLRAGTYLKITFSGAPAYWSGVVLAVVTLLLIVGMVLFTSILCLHLLLVTGILSGILFTSHYDYTDTLLALAKEHWCGLWLTVSLIILAIIVGHGWTMSVTAKWLWGANLFCACVTVAKQWHQFKKWYVIAFSSALVLFAFAVQELLFRSNSTQQGTAMLAFAVALVLIFVGPGFKFWKKGT